MTDMKTKLGTWLDDRRWAMNVMRARRVRRRLSFSQRIAFDEALRPTVPMQRLRTQTEIAAEIPPFTQSAVEINYPDAFYRVTVNDVIRAMTVATTPSESESSS